jgi:hypothetical protein
MKLKLHLFKPMDEDVNVIVELMCLASNIKNKFVGIFYYYFSFKNIQTNP